MIECERDECSFISWDPTARFACPCFMSSFTCSIDRIWHKQDIQQVTISGHFACSYAVRTAKPASKIK